MVHQFAKSKRPKISDGTLHVVGSVWIRSDIITVHKQLSENSTLSVYIDFVIIFSSTHVHEDHLTFYQCVSFHFHNPFLNVCPKFSKHAPLKYAKTATAKMNRFKGYRANELKGDRQNGHFQEKIWLKWKFYFQKTYVFGNRLEPVHRSKYNMFFVDCCFKRHLK